MSGVDDKLPETRFVQLNIFCAVAKSVEAMQVREKRLFGCISSTVVVGGVTDTEIGAAVQKKNKKKIISLFVWY